MSQSPRRSWPLKWTIPGIALVLVLLTEVVLGVSVLALTEKTLRSQADHKLELALKDLEERPGLLGNHGPDGSGMPTAAAGSDVIFAVYLADGTFDESLTRRLNGNRQVPGIAIDSAADGVQTLRGDGEVWRVLASTVGEDGATAVAMIPLRDVSSATRQLRRALIGGGLLVALAAAALAWVATKRSLAPLAEAERTAAAIAGGDLTRRVPQPPPGSEASSLAESLNAMLDRLTSSLAAREASEERLRRFVSDASHELRTPLAAIRGYAELSRMGADAKDQAIARIEANAERMAGLVDDLLLLARSDEAAGALAGDESVAVGALLDGAAQDLRAQDHNRTVTVACAPDLMVIGSPRHLSQVLANLGGNVLAHTPAGSAVDLEARREGTDVVIHVRDHGPGFGTEHAARAFERFYRADESRTRATGGAGLGLAIVAAIIRAHGGAVTAADAEGGGAVVTVRLPAARASL